MPFFKTLTDLYYVSTDTFRNANGHTTWLQDNLTKYISRDESQSVLAAILFSSINYHVAFISCTKQPTSSHKLTNIML